jgi:hypothetical protein
MATMTEAVQAALVGPERKKLKIYDHEFHVKPAQPEKKNNRLVVNGHISHHLTARPDDQVYYIITIENAAVTDIKTKIARGGWAGLAGPVASAIGAYFGVPIPPDKITSIGRELGRAFDGSWEMAAEIIIANIAMAFQQDELKNTPDVGATYIDAKYQELVQSNPWIGQPVSGGVCADGAGRYRHYAGGASILWHPQTGAHPVYGLIRDKYATLGWERSPVGYPTTDEADAGSGLGRYNGFQNGGIVWKSGTHEAFAVYGAIMSKWAEQDWDRGFLGFPITDEVGTPDQVGRFNHFEGGSIYWTPQTGAHFVIGQIRQAWADQGWETGKLGYPVTDELVTEGTDGKGRHSGFQGGVIYWTPDAGTTIQYH